MIVVTGASGKLGHHVIQGLLKKLKPSEIVSAVRNPSKAADLKALGVQVREADYEKPETLHSVLAGAQKVLLISSNDLGKRAIQHQAVINAAKSAGVSLLAYTSVLRANSSGLGLAKEHLDTERAILASGLPYVFLRNGWYLENHTENLASALQHGVIMGAAGKGRFASASREDYALAAVAVLTSARQENKTYELAGDSSFTLADLAEEVSKRSGKKVVYKDMPAADYEKALVGFGLPAPLAHLLADSDTGASKGDLDSNSHDLSKLIGRATTSLAQAVQKAI
jgi:NAD(P)H dehydrogenase (quinone)